MSRAGGAAHPRVAFLGLLALALSTVAAPAQQRVTPPAAPVQVNIRVTPLPAFESRDNAEQRFGQLVYRGGLELAADNKNFGGLSAIRVAADGARFLAVSDKGYWVSARILYHGKRPVGVAEAEIQPVIGPNGKPIQSLGWYDTEAMAEDGGITWLGLERVHRILRFETGKSGIAARGQLVTVPPGMKTMPANKGIEALAVVPKGQPLAGTLVAISEAALDAAGNIRGFLIGGKSPGEFTIRRSDDYDVSDCAITPKGDLLLLERRYSLWRGVASRIRRVALAQLAPNAVLDGPVIFEADMGYQIDNMEGMSVHRGSDGETVLTLVSDDNFSMLQRTLLLQFTLLEPE